jgi:hypothetical protein
MAVDHARARMNWSIDSVLTKTPADVGRFLTKSARCVSPDVDDEIYDDIDGSRPDNEIQLSQFPQTAPIDEAIPRQCPP